MAKKIRRFFAVLVAVSMCTSMIPQALAAETETETIVNGGLTTNVTTTTETVVDGDTTTVVVTIDKSTTGTDENGATVSGTETTTTTTTTREDGFKQEVTVNGGSETKTWTEEVKPGQEVEDVEAGIQYETDADGNLVPKTDANGNYIISGSVEGTPVVKTEGDTTTTTTTNREVNGTVKVEEEFVIVPDESKLECPVGPEDYAGKGYYDGYDAGENKYYRDGLLNTSKDAYEDAYVQPKPDEEGYDQGFDLTWTGSGDATDGAVAVVVKKLVYLTDENGEIVYENGLPVVDMEKSEFVEGKNGKQTPNYGQATGMINQSSQFALKHENGEYFYAYCMDASTGASPTINKWYNIRNIEDAIVSDENPDGYLTAEEAAKIRAIATNGYWGNEDGRGSVDALKELLKTTYGEEDVIKVRYPGSNEAHEFDIYELIDGLSEYEALAATQAAIWTFANKNDVTYDQGAYGGMVYDATVIGVLSAHKFQNSRGGWLNEYMPAKDGESDARLQALYACLLNLEPIYSDGELREDSTVIPNEDVMSDVALVIKDKVEDEAANLDDNSDNDVYNTELNFKLAFIPGENDEMFVCLMDNNNQPILGEDGQPIRKLLASETSAKSGDNVIKPVNGVYTLTGLKLSENSNFEFDLRLEGTQYLNEGVYIYQAEGGRNESQTLVGLAKGEQKVEVSNKVSITFDVDESSNVVAERVWYNEGDPITTDPTPQDPPRRPTPPTETEEIPEEDPPLTALSDDGEVILDEEVPLANVPKTGDNSVLWLFVSAAVVLGLVFVNLSNKKRTEA